MRTLLHWSSCICLLACGGNGEPQAAAAPSESGGAETGDPPDLAHHMDTSFWAAIDVRVALIDGNLEQARAKARTLAQQDFPTHPEAWRPWVKEMQGAASDVSVAADAAGVSEALGALGNACAKCHERVEGGPALSANEKQGAETWKDEDLTDRMRHHGWAENELWLGLVTPSEFSWRRGAGALAETFFTAPDREGKAISDETHERLLELRLLGEQAVKAGTGDARAAVYGKLLARCGDCHHQTAR